MYHCTCKSDNKLNWDLVAIFQLLVCPHRQLNCYLLDKTKKGSQGPELLCVFHPVLFVVCRVDVFPKQFNSLRSSLVEHACA